MDTRIIDRTGAGGARRPPGRTVTGPSTADEFARVVAWLRRRGSRQSVRRGPGFGLLTVAGAVLGGALVGVAGPAVGQGVGSTGFEVMQMPAGGRAAALAGAYAAWSADSDVIFYNPAAVGLVERAASLSYQRHVMDITLGSLSGTARVGTVSIGAGLAFLNGGEIPEIVPDERFGGQRGRPTGATVSARESAARIAVAMPLLDHRLHLGAAAGLAMSELAGISRSLPLLDFGGSLAVRPDLRVAAAFRNLGGSAGGDGGEHAIPAPSEARFGAGWGWRREDQLGIHLSSDVAYRLRETTAVALFGFEGGLVPDQPDAIGAVLRVGLIGDRHLPAASALQLGAGVSVGRIAIDYAYQDLEYFGAAHRFGLRWAELRPAR